MKKIENSLKKLAGIMIGAVFVASIFLGTAQADPMKVKISVACTAAGSVTVDNMLGTATAAGGCTATPAAFSANSDLDIKILAAAGVTENLNIADGTGNNKYKVDGNASNDIVMYMDNTGNDKLDFKGKAGADMLTVDDNNAGTGAGNDKYEAKDTSMTVIDGAGNDKYEGEHISMFMFTDTVIGDMDKIEVRTS